MKKDVLTLAAVVFVVGLIFSSFDIQDLLPDGNNTAAPAEFQQGFAIE